MHQKLISAVYITLLAIVIVAGPVILYHVPNLIHSLIPEITQ